MTFTKSQAAFTLSALKLFDEHPRVYFWTFTLREVMPDWRAMQAWRSMFQTLYNWHGTNLFGLRVVECHRSHGLHFHALLATRMSVHIARRAGKRFGFGRVHVCKADRGSILYLCKYLGKEKHLLPGARAWDCVGRFQGTKVRNIEVDSLFHRNMKSIASGRRVHYLMARDIYKNTMLWGDRKNWEKPKQSSGRTYYLDVVPKMYVPKREHTVEIDGKFWATYPASVFSRKKAFDKGHPLCDNTRDG